MDYAAVITLSHAAAVVRIHAFRGRLATRGHEKANGFITASWESTPSIVCLSPLDIFAFDLRRMQVNSMQPIRFVGRSDYRSDYRFVGRSQGATSDSDAARRSNNRTARLLSDQTIDVSDARTVQRRTVELPNSRTTEWPDCRTTKPLVHPTLALCEVERWNFCTVARSSGQTAERAC